MCGCVCVKNVKGRHTHNTVSKWYRRLRRRDKPRKFINYKSVKHKSKTNLRHTVDRTCTETRTGAKGLKYHFCVDTCGFVTLLSVKINQTKYIFNDLIM